MKSIGIVRQVDELGRVVLPVELRRTLQIQQKDLLEIFVDGDDIILKKYDLACVFCSEPADTRQFRGENMCNDCWAGIQSLSAPSA